MITAGDAQPGSLPADSVVTPYKCVQGYFVEILFALNKESRNLSYNEYLWIYSLQNAKRAYVNTPATAKLAI